MNTFLTFCPFKEPPEEDLKNTPQSVFGFSSMLAYMNGLLYQQVKERDEMIAAQAAIIDAQSAEIKKLNAQNKDLTAENKKLTKEIEKLRKRLNTNSTNSHTPPSKDPIGFKRSSKGKDKEEVTESNIASEGSEVTESTIDSEAKGLEQKASKKAAKKKRKAHHPGKCQKRHKPTREVNCFPQVCPHCGGTHFKNHKKSSTHQHIEIPEEPAEVTHFHIYSGTCCLCGNVSKGKVPTAYRDFYGPILTAFIAYVDSKTATTRRQLQDLLLDVFGIEISQGGIQNTIDRASEAIKCLYELIGEGARKSLYNHADETSWRTHGPVFGKLLHWLWFLGNSYLAFYRIDPHRSKEAFSQLVREWKGLLISDNYGVYTSWAGKRQSCLAHIMREAKKLAESPNREEARCGKRILAFLKYLFLMKDRPLPDDFITKLFDRTQRLVDDFGDLSGKAGTLVLRLFEDLETYTLFLFYDIATATNNFAERSLRPAVCQRKISIGSASEKGERWIERSLSVRMTCSLNKQSYFGVLQEAISSQTRHTRPNLLWLRKACARVTQEYAMISRPH